MTADAPATSTVEFDESLGLLGPLPTYAPVVAKVTETADLLRAEPARVPMWFVNGFALVFYCVMVAVTWNQELGVRVIFMVPGGMVLFVVVYMFHVANQHIIGTGPWFEFDKRTRTIELFRAKRSVTAGEARQVVEVADWVDRSGDYSYLFEINLVVATEEDAEQPNKTERLLVMHGSRKESVRVAKELAAGLGIPRVVNLRKTWMPKSGWHWGS